MQIITYQWVVIVGDSAKPEQVTEVMQDAVFLAFEREPYDSDWSVQLLRVEQVDHPDTPNEAGGGR